jgi:choline dehydrogenase-like flavoprotein
MLAWPYDSPRRGAATPARQFGEFVAGQGGWTLDGEPYTTAGTDQFFWFRSRMLGGRTNHWGRISLRYGPDDFRRRPRWSRRRPIYEDMKPTRPRRFVRRHLRQQEGLPNDPNGVFLPPPSRAVTSSSSSRPRTPESIIASRLSILATVERPDGVPLLGQCGAAAPARIFRRRRS